MSTPQPLLKIKSKYILCEILSNLLQIRLLKLIKYNKNMQKKLDINYIKKYKMIEIEIIPDDSFGQFINIDEKNDKYYHVYFNDNNEEKKVKKIVSTDKVKKIRIILDYEIKSFFHLFMDCCCNKKIIFKNFIRNDINNMRGMFYNCKMLKYIDLSEFRTENVTDMYSMFGGCPLEAIDLSSFNACNVTDISFMFSGNKFLKSIDLSKFNAKK